MLDAVINVYFVDVFSSFRLGQIQQLCDVLQNKKKKKNVDINR